MNHYLRAVAGAGVLGLALLPIRARAELTLATSAYGHWEYDSNVYALAPGVPIPGSNNLVHDDYYLAYGGTFVVDEIWQQQKFALNLQGEDFRYDRFSQLDHSEYTLAGSWAWHLLRDLSGTIEVRRQRSMVAFSNLIESPLVLETEQRETASAAYQVDPEWRIGGSGYTRTLDAPQPPQAPNLRLLESQGQAELDYTGLSRVVANVTASYLDGRFENPGTFQNIALPSYHQETVGAGATYKVTGLSTFLGQLGYTDRKSATGLNDISAVTGAFSYQRNLTGKTTMNLQLSRSVNSYIINSGSELDSNAGLILNWQATYKTGVNLNYFYTYRQLPDQGFLPDTDRLDHVQSIMLQINYVEVEGSIPRNRPADQVAPGWLIIRPYVQYQTRTSNYPFGGFNSISYGLLFTLQLQRQ
jgi:hypothetical protein